MMEFRIFNHFKEKNIVLMELNIQKIINSNID
jgi:hypothetical protein